MWGLAAGAAMTAHAQQLPDEGPRADDVRQQAGAERVEAVEERQPRPVSSGRAIDTLDLGTTSITGSRELPKVLYIVPWKRSDLGDIVGRPVNTLLDEVLAPIDPDVFERHIDYYAVLHPEAAESATNTRAGRRAQ